MQSDWQDLDPVPLKVVLKFAYITSGALCVMTSGMLLMLVWPADSWDSPDTVSVSMESKLHGAYNIEKASSTML